MKDTKKQYPIKITDHHFQGNKYRVRDCRGARVANEVVRVNKLFQDHPNGYVSWGDVSGAFYFGDGTKCNISAFTKNELPLDMMSISESMIGEEIIIEVDFAIEKLKTFENENL